MGLEGGLGGVMLVPQLRTGIRVGDEGVQLFGAAGQILQEGTPKASLLWLQLAS